MQIVKLVEYYYLLASLIIKKIKKVRRGNKRIERKNRSSKTKT